jgi:hypothetical protein
MLVSCDVFFATRDGRWNVLDPKNELETFKPSLDGYVENGAGWNEGPKLIAWPSSKIVLMRFDIANFPDTVSASYLRLFKLTSTSAGSQLRFHRIKESWDTLVSYTEAGVDGTFYDSTALTVEMSQDPLEEMTVSLTEIFSGDKDTLRHGIIIFSESEMVEFDSSESPSGPLLMLEPD